MNATSIKLFALTIALSGCVSLGELDSAEPGATATVVGDYLKVAECIKLHVVKDVPSVRTDINIDRKMRTALVSWHHQYGTMGAYQIKQVDGTHVAVNVYSALGGTDHWIKHAHICAEVV